MLTSWYGKYIIRYPLFTGCHTCQVVVWDLSIINSSTWRQLEKIEIWIFWLWKIVAGEGESNKHVFNVYSEHMVVQPTYIGETSSRFLRSIIAIEFFQLLPWERDKLKSSGIFLMEIPTNRYPFGYIYLRLPSRSTKWYVGRYYYTIHGSHRVYTPILYCRSRKNDHRAPNRKAWSCHESHLRLLDRTLLLCTSRWFRRGKTDVLGRKSGKHSEKWRGSVSGWTWFHIWEDLGWFQQYLHEIWMYIVVRWIEVLILVEWFTWQKISPFQSVSWLGLQNGKMGYMILTKRRNGWFVLQKSLRFKHFGPLDLKSLWSLVFWSVDSTSLRSSYKYPRCFMGLVLLPTVYPQNYPFMYMQINHTFTR